jgi:hypothetical protein
VVVYSLSLFNARDLGVLGDFLEDVGVVGVFRHRGLA